MDNASQGPEYKSIKPEELKGKLDRGESLILLDVREPWEFGLARIEGAKLVPISEVVDRIHELDASAETAVICHHGVRSAFVTRLLDRFGFAAAYNLEGGLDAYSSVDNSVPRY